MHNSDEGSHIAAIGLLILSLWLLETVRGDTE